MFPELPIYFAARQDPDRRTRAFEFLSLEPGCCECFGELRSKLADIHFRRLNHARNEFQRAHLLPHRSRLPPLARGQSRDRARVARRLLEKGQREAVDRLAAGAEPGTAVIPDLIRDPPCSSLPRWNANHASASSHGRPTAPSTPALPQTCSAVFRSIGKVLFVGSQSATGSSVWFGLNRTRPWNGNCSREADQAMVARVEI